VQLGQGALLGTVHHHPFGVDVVRGRGAAVVIAPADAWVVGAVTGGQLARAA